MTRLRSARRRGGASRFGVREGGQCDVVAAISFARVYARDAHHRADRRIRLPRCRVPAAPSPQGPVPGRVPARRDQILRSRATRCARSGSGPRSLRMTRSPSARRRGGASRFGVREGGQCDVVAAISIARVYARDAHHRADRRIRLPRCRVPAAPSPQGPVPGRVPARRDQILRSRANLCARSGSGHALPQNDTFAECSPARWRFAFWCPRRWTV